MGTTPFPICCAACDRAAQSRLGDEYHIHSDGSGLCLPHGGGLVQRMSIGSARSGRNLRCRAQPGSSSPASHRDHLRRSSVRRVLNCQECKMIRRAS
jgi:hypothetical protein